MSENQLPNDKPFALQTVSLSPKDIETLVAVGAIPRGTPPEVIQFFSRACSETRLSPFKRQIYIIKRHSKDGDRYSLQTAIDGFRTIADRTGRYAGNDAYVFDEGLSIYQMLEQKREKPRTAKATVWKIIGGVRCPFSAEVRWTEFYPGGNQSFMWDKMPFAMLGKCAEAAAHRKAFPEETSGIYTEDEMTIQEEIPRAIVPQVVAGNVGKRDGGVVEGPAQEPETAPPAAPVEKPKLKPKLKAKPKVGRFSPQVEFENHLANRKINFQTFLKTALENNWIDESEQSMSDISEDKYAYFLEKDNLEAILSHFS